MAEYLGAEVMEGHQLPTSLTWIEHYPAHKGGDRRILFREVL